MRNHIANMNAASLIAITTNSRDNNGAIRDSAIRQGGGALVLGFRVGVVLLGVCGVRLRLRDLAFLGAFLVDGFRVSIRPSALVHVCRVEG